MQIKLEFKLVPVPMRQDNEWGSLLAGNATTDSDQN
jgi:hypothetical protein